MKATAEQILRLTNAGKDKKGNEKKGKAVTLHVLREDWTMATPPREGRLYKVRNVKHSGTLFVVTALHVTKTPDGWDVIVRKGDHRDVPKLLRATPAATMPARKRKGTGWDARKPDEMPPEPTGNIDGDYTSQPSLAMIDEPEAVSDETQRGYARGAAVEDAASRDRLLREAREHIERGTEILQGLGSTTQRAASTIVHQLDKITPRQDQAA